MGAFGVHWVSEVADLGLLPLLVGMGDPLISRLPCGLVFWPLVRGKDSLRHALWPAPLCLAFVGCLPLAMAEVGGQMEASGTGGPFVY